MKKLIFTMTGLMMMNASAWAVSSDARTTIEARTNAIRELMAEAPDPIAEKVAARLQLKIAPGSNAGLAISDYLGEATSDAKAFARAMAIEAAFSAIAR